jgi:glycerol-3-phosphate acyltransferase PlsY
MLAAVAVLVAAIGFRQSWPVIVVAAGAATFVIVRHRANLARLIAGTESKIGQKAGPAAGETKP